MLETSGLKLVGLSMPVVKLFCVVRNVAGTSPFTRDWLITPNSASGALIPSSALPGRLKKE